MSHKQQQLSPEKYITTRARTLPIHKSLVTDDWEETKMATAVVIRQHVNGNFTLGIYLLDLMCLGVTDSMYRFNLTPGECDRMINAYKRPLIETDYNIVHNIIYAAHDFAADFDIAPHKSFELTKYILEEDNDDIPLIEIEVGDENGNPSLMVDPSYNYAPVLKKLEANAGKGNYTFYVKGQEEEDDLEDEDDDTSFDDNR
jgi:hypothetical protein